jgi:hypothetical protein
MVARREPLGQRLHLVRLRVIPRLICNEDRIALSFVFLPHADELALLHDYP